MILDRMTHRCFERGEKTAIRGWKKSAKEEEVFPGVQDR